MPVGLPLVYNLKHLGWIVDVYFLGSLHKYRLVLIFFYLQVGLATFIENFVKLSIIFYDC